MIKTKQPIFTPKIKNCIVCKSEADCIDWDFDFGYRVICKNNHTCTGTYNSVHKAICKWNNKQVIVIK